MVVELRIHGLACQRQVAVDVVYKDHLIAGQRLDLFVANEVVVEVKSVDVLNPIHLAQTLSYLRLGNLKLGLLLNFSVPLMKQGIKRVINRL